MVGKALSATIIGIDAKIIQVEVDLIPSQLPGFTIGGLPDKAVQEAKERIISSIKNAGYEWPRKKVVVNLAPADLPKSGTSFDLPIAIGILAASGQIEYNPTDTLFVGELSLEANLRAVNGALSIAIEAYSSKIKSLVLPTENSLEAGLVTGMDIIGVRTLEEAVAYIQGKAEIPSIHTNWENILNNPDYSVDFKNIKGQLQVKRAAEIAASGGHNLLLSGSPGSGKTMISKALPSILPELTFEEALEITKIYSVANLLENKQYMISSRPFRSPHHTASTTSIIGGGKIPKPGELSLAHRGILFLDEFPEFSSYTLEALRQPLEDKKVVVSRVSGTLTFPSNFMLLAAMNPCKCGWKGDEERECVCSPMNAEKYKKRISGPILDRIDLQVNVPRVKVEDLTKYDDSQNLSSAEIREKVQISRNIQLERYRNEKFVCNADLPQKYIEKYCPLSEDAKAMLLLASQKLQLSARSYFRIIRVARTIADLDCSEHISKSHVAEAIQYRITDF